MTGSMQNWREYAEAEAKEDPAESEIDWQGLLEKMLSERKKYREESVSKNRERLEAKYAKALSEEQIMTVLRYESDTYWCHNCDGKECRQIYGKLKARTAKLNEALTAIEYVACPSYHAYHMNCKVKSAKIPARYADKTFADYIEDDNNQLALLYAKNSLSIKCGAYLWGSYGCGKTFLAALIALEWLKAKKTVIFIKVPQLLSDIRSTYNESKVTEREILQELYRADLVVLDDMGMEKPSRFAGAILCNIIDSRYDSGKVTVITSNYPLRQVAQELDNAVDGKNLNGSRIYDRCREAVRPIELKGGSRR